MAFDIQQASSPEHRSQINQIRHQVFVGEQGVSEAEEQDGLDELDSTLHFIGHFDAMPIATGRVLANGKIGRVCVLPKYREKGYGKHLLQSMIIHCLEHEGRNELYLHAQTSALAFYNQAGFITQGEIFTEAGIEHQRMQFALQDRNTLEATYGDKVLRPDNIVDFCRHLRQCAAIANRSIHILSQDLSPALFTRSVVDSLSTFARSNKHAQICTLIQDTQGLGAHSHALVKLAQRLPSSIALRKSTESPQNPHQGYLIFDRRHMVFFNNEANYHGFINYCAAAESEHQLEEFDNLWRYHSQVDPNLNRLVL